MPWLVRTHEGLSFPFKMLCDRHIAGDVHIQRWPFMKVVWV